MLVDLVLFGFLILFWGEFGFWVVGVVVMRLVLFYIIFVVGVVLFVFNVVYYVACWSWFLLGLFLLV